MPLIVRLAGFNIDSDLVREVLDVLQVIEREDSPSGASDSGTGEARQVMNALAERIRTSLNPESFTPETISAAYARISRDPKAVTELRRAARFSVARSRKSNENIIFGLGHASVAEHATFNLDVLGLSRLASEELQSHRLLSFTEKSQRYVTLSADYVVPPEILGTAWEGTFSGIVSELFSKYEEIMGALRGHMISQLSGAPTKEEAHDAENRAKEDARYVLPLAVTTQMGMTLNARTAEHLIRDLSDHPLGEIRELSRAIREALTDLAPSLIKYVSRSGYPRTNRAAIARNWPRSNVDSSRDFAQGAEAKLIGATPDGEKVVLRALAFSGGAAARKDVVASLSIAEEKAIWHELFRGMGAHDGAPREFEMAEMTFEATISASCFAQLKRHRMMTMLSQPYNLGDGAVVPASIIEAGLEDEFRRTVEAAWQRAETLADDFPLLTPYLLLNGQRRRVLMHLNAREFYHMARLRCDVSAQWEIRDLAEQMLAQARETWPHIFALACGKDQFDERYKQLYPEG